MQKFVKILCFVVFLLLSYSHRSLGSCQFPPEYEGNWYHRDRGDDSILTVSYKQGEWGDHTCDRIYNHPNTITNKGNNATILLQAGVGLKQCLEVIYRSDNILQFYMGETLTSLSLENCINKTRLEHGQLTTLFKTKVKPTDCISSMEGRYQFSYEVSHSGGGICNASDNILNACQSPGSPYYDNKAFEMSFKMCPDIDNTYNAEKRFQCMGTWTVDMGKGNIVIFIALSDSVMGNMQDKFKCLMTVRDQKAEDNTIRWGLSRFGDCKQLNSLDGSPIKIVLRRILPLTTYMIPQCTFPRDMGGHWFTQGIQFTSKVWINDTHIRYMTRKNQYDYDDAWFSCQQRKDTRYLVSKVVVGRCEVNFVCFDFVPRHHSVVRYRVGQPMNIPVKQNFDMYHRNERFLVDAFKEACSWQWITFQRDNVDWKYEVLIQDPPSPVACPIGGRYNFIQQSNDVFQLYYTRIRGVTARPRNTIYCRNNVSEFKSCSNDNSRMNIDTEYCETVDYRGRPVGEYEEPDHVLACAGYWLEDMKSYLITYDEEDPVSRYRCWIYERISWTEVAMSRAETARCPRHQTSRSYTIDGAKLYMHLVEAERLFDDCPPRYDAGVDLDVKARTIFALDDSLAPTILPNILFIFITFVLSYLNL